MLVFKGNHFLKKATKIYIRLVTCIAVRASTDIRQHPEYPLDVRSLAPPPPSFLLSRETSVPRQHNGERGLLRRDATDGGGVGRGNGGFTQEN